MKGKGNDGSGNNEDRDLWRTEQNFWNKLNEQYSFSFDCCANKENTKTDEFSDNFTSIEKVDGVAWMNPPFSKAREMFNHFFKVVKKGVAIYRFDNPETKVWQEEIFPNMLWIFVPKGRISYTPFDITIRGGLTRFPSALIGIGVDPPKGIDGVILMKEAKKEED
jgi:hypothetical protein